MKLKPFHVGSQKVKLNLLNVNNFLYYTQLARFPTDLAIPESLSQPKPIQPALVVRRQTVSTSQLKKNYTISETFGNQGTKRKNDSQHEMEANKSASVPLKKAKTNEKAAKSASATAPRQKRAPVATPPKEKRTSKSSRKRANPTDDEDTAPDDPKTPVPPLKKPRGNKSGIVHKPQPVRRTGITLCI